MEPTRILVVEDDADTSALMARWLRTLGHTVEIRPSAELALAAVAREPYDLLMVDVWLPGMTGYEFVRRVRREGLSTARIAITSITDRGELPRGLAVDAWLSKPFSRTDLQRLVAQALGEKTDRDR